MNRKIIMKEMTSRDTGRPYRVIAFAPLGPNHYELEAQNSRSLVWHPIGDEYSSVDEAMKAAKSIDLQCSLDIMERKAGCQ